MVTAAALSISHNYQNIIFNENESFIDRPIVCIDGYLISCQYNGETCTPLYGIKMEDLLNSFKEELENMKKTVNTDESSTPGKSDDSHQKLSTSRSRSKTFTLHSPRQHNNETVRRNLFSSHDEKSLRINRPLQNTFLLPTTNNNSPEETEENHTNNLDCSYECVSPVRQLELNNQVKWFEKHGCDYINTETVHGCSELYTIINTLMKSTTAALVTLKVNSQTDITVTYQFMKKFKQDYMMVRINKSYCMLMKAF